MSRPTLTDVSALLLLSTFSLNSVQRAHQAGDMASIDQLYAVTI